MSSEDRSGSFGTFKAFAIAEGILLIVLGILALIFPVIASFWATGVIAVVFLISGLVGWISNLVRAPGAWAAGSVSGALWCQPCSSWPALR